MIAEPLPDGAPALYGLIALLPQAHGVPESELRSIRTDTWDDEGSTWTVKLNGTGQTHYPTVSPIGGGWPDPSAVEMFAGTFLVLVDDEALLLAHPTHLEWFTTPGEPHESKVWERAAIHAVRDRLDEVGLDEDLPPAEEFVRPEQRDDFWDTGGESA